MVELSLLIWARSKFEQVPLSRKQNHKEMKQMISFLLWFVSIIPRWVNSSVVRLLSPMHRAP